MGVTIHYRGKINRVEALPSMIEELVDIARAMHWEYTVLDESWELPVTAKLTHANGQATINGDLGLKGVSFKPAEKCESFSFYVDRTGHLRSVMGMLMIADGSVQADQSWISVKTQFSGPETHAWMIGLLKYLKNKYISNLEVLDEGDYWETEDVDVLCRKMDFINSKLNKIAGKLESSTVPADLSPKAILEHIQRILNDEL